MNEIQVFNYGASEIRTVQRDGQTWWILKDVCEALELTNPTIVADRLDDDEKDILKTKSDLGLNIPNRGMTIITESGLYNVILRSDKAEAKRFKRWVTHEVLPAIRKHGGYLSPAKIEEVLLNPDTIIRLATELKDEREKNVRLSAKIAKDREKVLFANAVGAANGCIQVGELAKLMCQNGYKIGRQRLFSLLRADGWIMRGSYGRYVPKQYAVQAGYMRIQERIIHVNGEERLTQTILITPKGQQYFINRYVIHQQPVFDWSGA